VLRLPGKLTPEGFLSRYWQKQPLNIPTAVDRVRPAISRHELAWLATLEDVESRIVFTERRGAQTRYRAVTGPFDEAFLGSLPGRDWTLLVHDVEKHLPRMRSLFGMIPFVPDWRIDDLMVSFAAPGGGVGPHVDNYDVFLCQGIGVREWRICVTPVAGDPSASDELALCLPFEGTGYDCRNGDVLYLPPGVAHWGTARRACMTYSIGMRAPRLSDLLDELPDSSGEDPFFTDGDLGLAEVRPGYISVRSVERAMRLLDADADSFDRTADALGRFVTLPKEWLSPDAPDAEETGAMLDRLRAGAPLAVHGMTRIAWDDRRVYVNGTSAPLPDGGAGLLAEICARRSLTAAPRGSSEQSECIAWMVGARAFDIPEIVRPYVK